MSAMSVADLALLPPRLCGFVSLLPLLPRDARTNARFQASHRPTRNTSLFAQQRTSTKP